MVRAGGLPAEAHTRGKRERRWVRKRGFEPLRYCYRQPFKLEAVNVDRSRPPEYRGRLSRMIPD